MDAASPIIIPSISDCIPPPTHAHHRKQPLSISYLLNNDDAVPLFPKKETNAYIQAPKEITAPVQTQQFLAIRSGTHPAPVRILPSQRPPTKTNRAQKVPIKSQRPKALLEKLTAERDYWKNMAMSLGAAAPCAKQTNKSSIPPDSQNQHTPQAFSASTTSHKVNTPIVGKMYAVHFGEHGTCGVMVLPRFPSLAKNCPKVAKDLMDKLVAIDLEKSEVPECFLTRYSTIVNWAPGFEDGGSRVEEREYPILWFDENRSIGWTRACHLVNIDFESACRERI